MKFLSVWVLLVLYVLYMLDFFCDFWEEFIELYFKKCFSSILVATFFVSLNFIWIDRLSHWHFFVHFNHKNNNIFFQIKDYMFIFFKNLKNLSTSGKLTKAIYQYSIECMKILIFIKSGDSYITLHWKIACAWINQKYKK